MLNIEEMDRLLLDNHMKTEYTCLLPLPNAKVSEELGHPPTLFGLSFLEISPVVQFIYR